MCTHPVAAPTKGKAGQAAAPSSSHGATVTQAMVGSRGELFATPLLGKKTHLPAAKLWYTPDPTAMTQVALLKPRVCGLVWGVAHKVVHK